MQRARVIERVEELLGDSVTPKQEIGLLRAVMIALSRRESFQQESLESLGEIIVQDYPTGMLDLDRLRETLLVAMDHPDVVSRVMLLDIAPTLAMYESTDMVFAAAYWHWFFMIQPAPFPETLINAEPEFFVDSDLGPRSSVAGVGSRVTFPGLRTELIGQGNGVKDP